MAESKLKLNAYKTVSYYWYTKAEQNLGVTFDNNLNFRQHISQTCRCAFYHIRDLRRNRRYMYFAVAKTIATALVSSRLDYCNSLYHNIALEDFLKFQRMQNCLARVVTRSPRFSHSLSLKSMHWLSLRNRIIFQICAIIYQALSYKQPAYLYYIHCSLLENSIDNFDHLIITYLLFPVLRQMSELEIVQLLHLLCGTHSLLVLSL